VSSESEKYGRSYSPRQLEFLKAYSGGFDRLFFERHLRESVEEYTKEHGSVELEVTLADGMTFEVTRVAATMTSVRFGTDDDEVVIVPHREVMRVVLRQPAGPEPKKKSIGFGFIGEETE
jgi:hypothetical protein